jgi:AcrR family transcriptional regulator
VGKLTLSVLDANGPGRMSEEKTAPRRSLLAQERSRDTRRAIVRAALKLFAERGYETGVDDTTAEEIAKRAGVAKATFYYHFARKEDIFLETGWLTAKVFYEDALKALMNGGSTDQIIDDVTSRLCRRIERVPRPALRRILQVLLDHPPRSQAQDSDHFGFRRGFAIIVLHGQQEGDIPQAITPASLGMMFEVLLMSAIQDWAFGADVRLADMLRERFAVLLAGARHVSASAAGRPAQRGRPEPRQGKPRTRTV